MTLHTRLREPTILCPLSGVSTQVTVARKILAQRVPLRYVVLISSALGLVSSLVLR